MYITILENSKAIDMNIKITEEIKKNYKIKTLKSFVNTYVKRKDVKKISEEMGFENLSEFLYFIVNDLNEKPSCKECGKEVSFDKISTGYREFCSVKCARNNEKTKEKTKQTNLEKYGVETPLQNEEVKQKIKKTNLERYGVENPSQNEEVKEKKKQATDYILISKKYKKTNLERYGVEYYFQSKEFKENNNYSITEEVKEKIKQTNLERYGVECSLQNEEVKQKIKKTNLERYGVENPSQNKEVREKVRNTTLKNFGVECGFLTEESIKKRKKEDYNSIVNNRKEYVVPLFEESEYKGSGYENEYFWKCVKCGNVFKSHVFSSRIPRCFKCYPTIITTSSSEKEMIDFIKGLGFAVRKKRYKKFEIDALIEEKNIGFEMNGLYWHSEIGGKKDRNYHINKTLFFNELGYKIFHIFENEWLYKKDIVKSIIKNKLGIIDDKIFARKCKLKKVSSKDLKKFYDKNHIQGHIKSSVNLALFYNNEIVCALSISKSRFEKNAFEIIRFANKLNTSVVGGFSKLLKYYLNNFSFDRLITYSDKRFFDGSIYLRNGFVFDKFTKPNYFYMYKYKDTTNRMKFQKHKLKKTLDVFNENLT